MTPEGLRWLAYGGWGGPTGRAQAGSGARGAHVARVRGYRGQALPTARPSGDRATQRPRRTSAQRRDGLRGGDHGTRRVRQDDPARGVGRARPAPVRVGLGGRGRRRSGCVPGTRRGRARSDRADRAARARVHRVADGSQLHPGALASEFGARHADAAVRARPGRPRPHGGNIGHGHGVDDRRLRPRGFRPRARGTSPPGRRAPPPACRRPAAGGGRRGPRAASARGVSVAPRCRRPHHQGRGRRARRRDRGLAGRPVPGRAVPAGAAEIHPPADPVHRGRPLRRRLRPLGGARSFVPRTATLPHPHVDPGSPQRVGLRRGHATVRLRSHPRVDRAAEPPAGPARPATRVVPLPQPLP